MQFSRSTAIGVLVFAAGLGAGCGRDAASVPPARPDQTTAAIGVPSGARSARSGPLLYIANASSPSITEYRIKADGNVAPVRTIAGSKTQMGLGLGGIAVDSTGVSYVTSVNGGILEYAPGANGNVAPIRTITGSTTGPVDGYELAIDSSDNLYLANGNDIKVFAPGAQGVATPIADIVGPATKIGLVEGVGVDAAGNVYAVDFEKVAILKFAPGATGNVAPIATIAGDKTTMAFPRYIGVSPEGELFISDEDAAQVFRPNAHGNVRPSRTITFDSQVGPYGNFAVAGKRAFLGRFGGGSSWSVGVYSSRLHGPSDPLATIVGDQTQLSEPVGAAVR
jgi:hypothetical protein